MFSEDDCLPLSALQHLLYCDRQCALIHIEQLWVENSLTVRGKHLHERADSGKRDTRNGVRSVRSLPLRSLQWGLVGKADIVEFDPDAVDRRCYPVEYKRGRPKAHDADRVQLCAQALCLEEMLGSSVPTGALFYGKTRRRLEVAFDESLRRLTEQTIHRLHELIAARQTPPAVYEKAKCERCSLLQVCVPRAASHSSAASNYVNRIMADVLVHGPASD